MLYKLVLSNNNLTTVEDDALGRLEMLTILHLDNNQLTQIPLSLPSNLMKLFIQANHIADIRPDDLANLNNLELLDLSNNRIIYMPQLALPSLITLSVKMNELENVQHQMLRTCPSLRHLFNVGNPIKCAELLELGEICIDDSQEALNNKYINDDIDYNQDDVKREEKHLNSQSYFHRFNVNGMSVSGGLYRCQRQRRRNDGGIKGSSNFTADADVDGMETLPNCWSEKEKLITPLIFTNDSTSSIITTTITTAMPSSTTTRREKTAAALNDNKFTQQTTRTSVSEKSSDDKIALSNDKNLSNNITSTKMTQEKQDNVDDDESKKKSNVKTKNVKSSVMNDKVKSSKITSKMDKLRVNVANKEIKRLNGNFVSNDSATQQQQHDNETVMQQHLKVDEVSLMKSNQIKTNDNDDDDDGRKGNHSHTRTLIAQIENPQLVASEKAINRNLIDNVHRKGGNDDDYRIGKTTTQAIQSKSELISASANKIKVIKDNDGRRSFVATKSIDNVHTPPAKVLATKDNKSNNEQPLQSITMSIAEGVGKKRNNQGNEGILEATDHHHQQQHSPINHSMEKWNDVRNESINHPGLLVIITVSVGFFFIFTLVYVYRCDFINSARRRHARNGSFESINEGRDVLNDNFNEETRSFTIESYGNSQQRSSIMIHQQQQHQHQGGGGNGSNIINQNDLLPMDILNSSINSSTLDPPPHISMHLW